MKNKRNLAKIFIPVIIIIIVLLVRGGYFLDLKHKGYLKVEQVTSIQCFVGNESKSVYTKAKNLKDMEYLIGAYNEASPYDNSVGTTHSARIEILLNSGEKITVAGGSQGFQTVMRDGKQFNIKGAKLWEYFKKVSRSDSEAGYTNINKTFTGFIYSSEGKLVKEIPVIVKGREYKETKDSRDYFTGSIEIEGEKADISSTKNKAAVISNFDTQNFFLALNPSPDFENGVVEHTSSVTISKDFTKLYGYTLNLSKSYGKGAFFKSDKDIKTPEEENARYKEEASKRVKLYISAMSEAFKIENGGNGFIAVKEASLEGFKEEKSKQDIIDGLKKLSQNLYWYEGVKNDKSLFEFDESGRMTRTLNGTILSVRVEEFSGNEAVIAATSWFGNLGAVIPKYKATYKNGEWELKVIGMAIS